MKKTKNCVRKDVMSEANAMIAKANLPRPVAMKKAWMLSKLAMLLATGVATTFTYVKMDGGTRKAVGLPASTGEFTVKGTGHAPNKATFLYWDVERGQFRCFRRSNIVSVG